MEAWNVGWHVTIVIQSNSRSMEMLWKTMSHSVIEKIPRWHMSQEMQQFWGKQEFMITFLQLVEGNLICQYAIYLYIKYTKRRYTQRRMQYWKVFKSYELKFFIQIEFSIYTKPKNTLHWKKPPLKAVLFLHPFIIIQYNFKRYTCIGKKIQIVNESNNQ